MTTREIDEKQSRGVCRRPWATRMRPATVALMFWAAFCSGGFAAAAPVAFDAHDPTLRYAEEYRDPTWNGTYLRQRWYDPRLPSFVSRDPAARQLNRYGYGGGNPAMHVDPSGRSYHGMIGRRLEGPLARLNHGVGGHFARFFLSPLMAPLQIAADPASFWRSVEHDRHGIAAFIATGIVVEVGTSGFGPTFEVPFAARLGIDQLFGFGQATASSVSGGRFHGDAFAASLEYHFGAEAWTRGVLGFGYRPFALSVARAERLALTAGEGEADIFRARYPVTALRGANTSPFDELTRTGFYHEVIVAIAHDRVLVTEYASAAAEEACVHTGVYEGETLTTALAQHDLSTFGQSRGAPRLKYVGRIAFDPEEDDSAFYDTRGRASTQDLQRKKWGQSTGKYKRWSIVNNSHWHARAVLEDLGVR